eukprot:snap_masked-scaffold_32-processed-gene-3.12-mRNA-1 protein AED:1.00 eAED:1.00 QI:0/0/0/0/1/1/3/0/66
MKDIDIAIFVLLTIFTALLWHLMVEDMERERRKLSFNVLNSKLLCKFNSIKTTTIFTLISQLHRKF